MSAQKTVQCGDFVACPYRTGTREVGVYLLHPSSSFVSLCIIILLMNVQPDFLCLALQKGKVIEDRGETAVFKNQKGVEVV